MAVGKVDKWKMKRWFTVTAPKVFNEVSVGEIPANSESSVVSRNIIMDLFSLTNNPAHMYTNVHLKVAGVKGEAVQTRLTMIEQLYSYIRSLARRHRTITEVVIPLQSKDGIRMIAKPIIVANGRITSTRTRALRDEAIKELEAHFKRTNASDIVSEVIDKRLQSEISTKLKRITPINKFEIKKLEIPEGI